MRPIVERPGNPRINRQFAGLYLRRVGPARTEFDYWCFIAKMWRLRFIINRYYYGIRFRVDWWPGDCGPAISLLRFYRGFKNPLWVRRAAD